MNNCVNAILEGIYSKGNKDSRVFESNDAYEKFLKECQANPTYKKAASIAKKYGYTVAPLCYVETYGGKSEDINFSFEYDDKKYKPEVMFSKFGKQKGFVIQTTSYGSLSVDEHDKYLDEAMKANKMVKELSKLDLTTLCRYNG